MEWRGEPCCGEVRSGEVRYGTTLKFNIMRQGLGLGSLGCD